MWSEWKSWREITGGEYGGREEGGDSVCESEGGGEIKRKRPEEEGMGKRSGGDHATFHFKPALFGSPHTSPPNVHTYTDSQKQVQH